MASITQTIPSFSLGISQQPDHLKFPGQVTDIVNAIPDVTRGLFKRPGAKRIGTDALASVQTGGSWFHYHRDETEGSYIGQVAPDGQVRVWSCKTGALQTTVYGTGGQTAIQNYLATSTPENLQFLTINDTTFINSRDTTNSNTLVGMTGSSTARPDPHFAFIELLRTENGRQYSLNINDGAGAGSTIKRATKIKITNHNFGESDGTGHCPGIGTEVYVATAKSSYTATENIASIKNSGGTVLDGVNQTPRDNLIFRVTALGQQGVSPNYSASSNGPDGQNYRCSYNIEVVLLHGGEGWHVGDVVRVEPEHASEAKNDGTQAFVDVTVLEIEETTGINGSYGGNNKAGLIRPTPTPFDADTAVTPDTVLGGIIDQLPNAITHKIIGTGLYLKSNSAFNVEVLDDDLMRCFQGTVNDVTRLPNQCKHGYIVQVSNSQRSDEDDYFLKFEGENNQSGAGKWVECAKPGITTTLTNMPLVIQRTAFNTNTQVATFTVKQFTYAQRRVGDNINSNLDPSFVGGRINKVLFFRNRLALLSGENVSLCRPGTLGEPDFFIETALTVSATDPIDIACSSIFPSELFDGIETNTGLLVFSTNQQFLLASDDTVLNPDTAKLRSIASFNYNKAIAPISLGTTVAYLDNSGKFSRFNEMANVRREGEPNIVEVSKIVSRLLPKELDLLTNSRENSIVLMGKTGSDTVFGYKYFQVADKRSQASWFKWKLNNPLTYHFIVNDQYFFLDSDYYLQSLNLIRQDTDPTSIDQNNVEYLLHLDNYVDISGGVFNVSTNTTTFSNLGWLNTVTTPNYNVAVIHPTDGRYQRENSTPTSLVANAGNQTISLTGNWSRVVTSITVTNGGSGYTSAPTVSISGTGASATATIANGSVTAITVNDGGYNFSSAPTVTISGGGGSSAAATAAISTGVHTAGYIYDYKVELPTLFPTNARAEKVEADINSSLVIHRVKFHFGTLGTYKAILKRNGKNDFEVDFESTPADDYLASTAPYTPDFVKTVPIFERNENVDIILESTHPSPATLRGLSWEGDYSPKFYKRV
tara:strand:+ start:700 stop:3834 length:3135 start_codon:yes stop_codon:yes gene_type:complete